MCSPPAPRRLDNMPVKGLGPVNKGRKILSALDCCIPRIASMEWLGRPNFGVSSPPCPVVVYIFSGRARMIRGGLRERPSDPCPMLAGQASDDGRAVMG